MEPMTVRELLTATGGRLLGEEAVAERTITGVETDSRAVHEGDLFVALRGERTDGHRSYCQCAGDRRRRLLTEEVPQVLLPGKFYIQVEDTMLAIGQVARAYREKFPIPRHRHHWQRRQNHHQGHGGLGIGAEVPGFENGGKLQQRAGSSPDPVPSDGPAPDLCAGDGDESLRGDRLSDPDCPP